MIVISDSYTFLLEKIAKSKKIHIQEIINLSPKCFENLPINSDITLILISESFYNMVCLSNCDLMALQ